MGDVLKMYFTAQDAARLAHITPEKLRRWVRTEAFHPIRGTASGVPTLFLFRDVLALRVLSELRSKRASLQHLRQVGSFLRDIAEGEPWSKIKVGLWNGRVHFSNPKTGRIEEALTGQVAADRIVAIAPLEEELTKVVRVERTARQPETHGRVVRTRGVLGGEERFDGTRIPVSTVIDYIEAGYDEASILTQYPSLTPKDIAEARRRYRGKKRRVA